MKRNDFIKSLLGLAAIPAISTESVDAKTQKAIDEMKKDMMKNGIHIQGIIRGDDLKLALDRHKKIDRVG